MLLTWPLNSWSVNQSVNAYFFRNTFHLRFIHLHHPVLHAEFQDCKLSGTRVLMNVLYLSAVLSNSLNTLLNTSCIPKRKFKVFAWDRNSYFTHW